MHKSVHSVNLPLLAVMLLDLLHLLLGVCNVPDLNKTITQARKHQFLLGVGVVKEGQTLDLYKVSIDHNLVPVSFQWWMLRSLLLAATSSPFLNTG